MSDKELVIRAKDGDAHAFTILYGKYKKKLYGYAFYRLGNKADAEDAVQDCVLSAFEQINKLKKAESFSSWIFRILYCCCTSAVKEQIRQRNTDNIEDYANVFTITYDETKEQTELKQALEVLSDEEREIVLLSVVAGFKSKEIAQISGLTAGSVRSKLSRSLAKLKNELVRGDAL
ncbi:MAG: RNA polymerase sigma factor [Eubacterium sp.]|nr:RNA polymerase sigma factor [Eubacterium sp.]